MSEQVNEKRDKLDESAEKLHEGAEKLDEGAEKLHEGAAALHVVASALGADAEPSESTDAPTLVRGVAGTLHLDAARASAATWPGAIRTASARLGQRAVQMVERRPLTSLVALGLAAGFVQIELALGLFAGVAAAALLVQRRGAEVREQMLARGRHALVRARSRWAGLRTSAVGPAASAATG